MSLPRDATRLTLREWIPFAAFPVMLFVLVMFAVQETAEQKARAFVLERLDGLPADFRVEVNGRAVEEGAVLAGMVRQLKHGDAHHSSPATQFRVRFIGRGPCDGHRARAGLGEAG